MGSPQSCAGEIPPALVPSRSRSQCRERRRTRRFPLDLARNTDHCPQRRTQAPRCQDRFVVSTTAAYHFGVRSPEAHDECGTYPSAVDVWSAVGATFSGGRRWRFFATGQISPTDPRSALEYWRTFARTSPKDGDRRENQESHLPIGLLAAGENAFGSYADSGADPTDSANSPQKRASLCSGNCSLRSYTTVFLVSPLVSDQDTDRDRVPHELQ